MTTFYVFQKCDLKITLCQFTKLLCLLKQFSVVTYIATYICSRVDTKLSASHPCRYKSCQMRQAFKGEGGEEVIYRHLFSYLTISLRFVFKTKENSSHSLYITIYSKSRSLSFFSRTYYPFFSLYLTCIFTNYTRYK